MTCIWMEYIVSISILLKLIRIHHHHKEKLHLKLDQQRNSVTNKWKPLNHNNDSEKKIIKRAAQYN